VKISNWKSFIESLQENPISNIDLYNKRMEGSLIDKLFFIKKIKFDSIVDFGCADGILLQKIYEINPNIKLIGYEIDPVELEICQSKLKSKAFITDNWAEIADKTKYDKSPILCLSSVIHEVYSYASDDVSIDRFWNERVFGGIFKYIVIRDMITSDSIDDEKNFKNDVDKIKSKFDPSYIKSFENIWGNLENSYKQLTHFLLKYNYTNNWQREVRENYFPMTISELRSKIPSNYSIVYEKNFILKYILDQVRNDFGIELRHPTHTKMIIKRND